jgi:hypothetical protein
MPRLPTLAEQETWYHEAFAETFNDDPQEYGRFFSGVERAGHISCSRAGQHTIIVESRRYKLRAEARGRFDDFRTAKQQLERVHKKAVQSDNVRIITKAIKRLRTITDWEMSSPVWDAFEAELEREDLRFTFRLWDVRPSAGDGRTRFARACRTLLENFDTQFGHRRGSRASESRRASIRKDWVEQVVRVFAQEGGSLAIRNNAEGKDGLVIDFVRYLYDALPASCTHTDIGSVARHDIAPIAQKIRKQLSDSKS